jgi:hypothetical protein
MRNQLHELSIDDLAEVSGGIAPDPFPFPGFPGPLVPGGHHPGGPRPVFPAPDPIPFPGIHFPPGLVFN